MRLRLRLAVSGSMIVAAALGAAACGTEQAEPADSAEPAVEPTDAPATTLAPATTVASTTTAASTTTIAAVTLPAAAGAWSSAITADVERVVGAFSEPGGAPTVFGELFALPVEAPWPDDALLSYARHGVAAAYQGGFEEVWSAWTTTAGAPADVEAAFAAAFGDDRFGSPDRSENDMGPYVAVTLTYRPTTEAVADGWSAMTVTVLPEMDATMAATGRTDLRVDLTRTVAELPELSTFVGGWLEEAPVVDDVSPIELNVEAGAQPAPRLTYNARLAAPQAEYDRLVEFYASEHTAGALVYAATEAPADLAEVEWFSGDPSATLAGHPLTVNVERYLPEPDEPAVVTLGITITGG